ncbi:hypothetical protein [Streptomyces sp. NPDC059828]|uniref:hypothetical protein n=1 Tax=Streptomyces sp. NPDC059828 TaxID=3346965 RepID=UPI003652F71D
MCISTGPAEFSGTTLYAGRRQHPEHGLIHVVGYQNTAVNLVDGPNAMLLHLPTQGVGPEHFLPVRDRDRDVLHRMVVAVQLLSEDGAAVMDWMEAPPAPAVQVFEHDVYTVLLAADPTLIPEALGRVPRHKRPNLEPGLFAFYAEHFPAHTIALCCFDNAQAQQAKPLLLWYEPHDPDELVLPALDCHTGRAPDLDAEVEVDHWVVFSTDEAPDDWGAPVDYQVRTRRRLREYLPALVVGKHFEGRLPNGDFALSHADLLAGDMGAVRRLRPAS